MDGLRTELGEQKIEASRQFGAFFHGFSVFFQWCFDGFSIFFF